MLDLLSQLRRDAGPLTLAQLVREREAPAHEIERLTSESSRLRESSGTRSLSTRTPLGRTVTPKAVATKQSEPTRALLRLSGVSALVGLGRSTLYARIADSTFPRRTRFGKVSAMAGE